MIFFPAVSSVTSVAVHAMPIQRRPEHLLNIVLQMITSQSYFLSLEMQFWYERLDNTTHFFIICNYSVYE